ncbi:cytochrome c oxidase accessory protein CcoG [Marinobacterium sediminicola]|uniref:Cytochrome c oxidase accessory protein FixG n=1 Tax=Marinobacterium sediminicola TaxID=518898 RepID=A0ABY1RVP3_9GAMM|nr:cytochrome c oxidase accessory protein CcoG [Marinobacterium sediminicola]ULG70583.1 cytochrome c oxidase accessory protein CcoG [Marinobacterium sediminicola]SMR68946.1 cytochrome c oxidase accessory protein FixG [Marinobacterium sediminicola]
MNQIPVKDVTPRKEGKDQVENYNLYAKREHIYVKFYKGLFKNLRIISSFMMLAMFYGVSWIQYDGRQAVLFDLPNRQFHIFGLTFWPQDFMLLSWLLIILAFTLFFVTVFAGRLWCGYSCPQFVWTWLFIWAERITEGDRNKRMRMDKQPMSKEKAIRKSAKHLIWILIAIASAIAFVGYFSPIRELIPNILAWDLGPWETWWLAFFTVATYGNAGWLREQVCIYMCPYARFQSVMFDQDTLIISYDEARGEPRGSRKKNAVKDDTGLGDCIDCHACVHVCPVGIDIRDGLQYECVACGACVDACDDMMDRMGYARGLVRYTTEHSLNGKQTKLLRPRLIGYFVALITMFGAFIWALTDRVPLEVDVIRDRGQLYNNTPSGLIENVYTLKVANKEQTDHRYIISVSGLQGLEIATDTHIAVAAGELLSYPVRLQIDPDILKSNNTTIQFMVEAVDNSNIRIETESRFLGPIPQR